MSVEEQPLFGNPALLGNVNEQYQYVRTNDESSPTRRIIVPLLLFVSFLSSFCFSVIVPSLFFYLQAINVGVVWLGWAVAAHSAGTVVSAPLIIMWARRRPLHEVLIGCLLLMAAGNIMYAQACCASSSATGKLALLLVSRLVVGMSSGVHSVGTAYLAHMSTARPSERIMPKNGMAVIAGFIFGPALAVVLSFVDFNIGSHGIFNSYTTPGYITALIALFAAIPSVLWMGSKSPRVVSTPNRNSNSHIQNNSAARFTGSISGYGLVNSVSYSGLGSLGDMAALYNILASKKYSLPVASCIVCFTTYFTLTLSFVLWETVGSALTEKYLNWGVLPNCILFTCMGVVAVIALWILKLLSHIIADKVILVASAVVTGSAAAVLIIPLAWSPVPFSVAVFFVVLGYTLSINAVLQLYSKMLAMNTDTPPSAIGWLSYCGSIARVLGPIGAAYILDSAGVLPLFAVATVLPFVSALAALCCFYRLPV